MEEGGGEFGGVGEIKRFLPCCLEERVVEEVDGLEAWEVRRDLFQVREKGENDVARK